MTLVGLLPGQYLLDVQQIQVKCFLILNVTEHNGSESQFDKEYTRNQKLSCYETYILQCLQDDTAFIPSK
jgi:hypothetical protein